MSAADDLETLEALIRSEMARVAAFAHEAGRGSFSAINSRRFLFGRLDGLFDAYAVLELRAVWECECGTPEAT